MRSPDHDIDEPEHRAIGPALEDLARTIPDEPTFLDGINQRIAGLRRRRRVARAATGVALCGLAVGGLAVARRASSDVTGPSASATASPGVGAACTDGAPPVPVTAVDPAAAEQKQAQAALEAPSPEATGPSSPDGTKVAVDTAASGSSEPASVTRIKLGGTLVGPPSGNTIVVRVDASSPVAGDVTVTLDAGTRYFQDGTVVSRAAFVDGDHVVLAAHQTGSAYVAEELVREPDAAPTAVVPNEAETQAKGTAKVVEKNGSVVTLIPHGNWLDDTTVLTADLAVVATNHSDGRPCGTIDLAPGDAVAVLVAARGPRALDGHRADLQLRCEPADAVARAWWYLLAGAGRGVKLRRCRWDGRPTTGPGHWAVPA